MSFTTEKIKHNAKLVRLKLSDEMAEKLVPELNEFMDFIKCVDEVNTDGVEPLVSVANHELRLRDDKVEVTCSREEVLKNGTDATNEFFTVPKIIE